MRAKTWEVKHRMPSIPWCQGGALCAAAQTPGVAGQASLPLSLAKHETPMHLHNSSCSLKLCIGISESGKTLYDWGAILCGQLGPSGCSCPRGHMQTISSLAEATSMFAWEPRKLTSKALRGHADTASPLHNASCSVAVGRLILSIRNAILEDPNMNAVLRLAGQAMHGATNLVAQPMHPWLFSQCAVTQLQG